jgi:Arc/MetJ-type ribon-helix-helix transcriptional regulator
MLMVIHDRALHLIAVVTRLLPRRRIGFGRDIEEMNLTLPSEVEQRIRQMVLRGDYASPEELIVDAVTALLREQERRRIEDLLLENGIDDSRIEQLLQEAEDSGAYTEMTAQDWEDIEREALALVKDRKSA